MRLTGWDFEGALPNEPKFVIIIAPHTSNWEFPLGVAALFTLGFRISFLGKHTIFRWPAGPFMRWLGGIPVVRTISRDRVAEAVGAFNAADQLILVIAPEGTRKLVPRWKTGFYHIAHGAQVPIVPIFFDFRRKVVGLLPPFRTTGDQDGDISRIKEFFRGVTAKHPENYAA